MDKFEVQVVNYFEKDRPVAEAYHEAFQWAELFEEGNRIRVKFYSHPTQAYWQFSYREAVQALEKAKTKLQTTQKKVV